ncbi:MAG TPA: hypothetical protein VFY10_06925 [Dehalococcoidia bacterium]|nr:hypothetical protein [Dehalococcoidia bacterium]
MRLRVARVRQHLPDGRAVARSVAVLLVLAALIGAWGIDATLSLKPEPNEYSIVTWEARNFPGKWLYLIGQPFRSHPSEAKKDADVQRYFALDRDIEALENQISDAAQRGEQPAASTMTTLATKRSERDGLENEVEATIEGRLTAVIEQEGLARNFGIELVWPPVDFEFTDAPRTLAISPRDQIKLIGTSLLRPDLSLSKVEQIEAQTEQKRDVSALAFPLGGLGAYPTIIDYPDDYADALSLIAHEWMHNYLFFRPLGFNYYKNNDLETMNETTADLVGQELAKAVLARWPALPEPQQAPSQPSQPTTPQVDAGAVLRQLRGDVDKLLAAGKIDEAEALMEQKRRDLDVAGYYIRKLNQAYFAFLNLYAGEAGSPAAVNPIGPKIDELRKRSASLKQFVLIVGGLTSVRQLDAALARLR